MEPAFLGIDIGTSGVKALLVSHDGSVLASAGAEYPLRSPHPLWAEQDPRDWWDAVRKALRTLDGMRSVSLRRVSAVGLTGQMHGLVALDVRGEPVRPCILWNDQRTFRECARITEAVGADRILRITGKPVLPNFTAPKLLWLRVNEPDAYARTAHVLLPKDYIRYRLTGAMHGDVSDASGTSLLDVGTRRWSDEMIAALEIPYPWLPELYESPQVTAAVSPEAARETGLREGIPVVAGAGDQAAEAVGAGVVAPGDVSLALGTSGVVFAALPSYRYDAAGRIHTYCHAVPGGWHVMGVMLSAGGSLRWYRDTFGDTEKSAASARGADAYDILTAEAAEAPPGCDGLLFLPYLSGERTPHADPSARGVFFGFTLRHRKAHFTRAVLEGVGFGLRDALGLVRSLGLRVDSVRATGGGIRSAVWRRILADILGVDILTVNTAHGAAFGAALLAGTGAGFFASVEEAVARTVLVTGRETAGEASLFYERLYERYSALYPALRGEFTHMREFLEREAGKGGEGEGE
ncbi:MAG: xylulokinase [Bacteroidota bacterium]|nr:xylulokinase [Bacteroidota bacterium]